MPNNVMIQENSLIVDGKTIQKFPNHIRISEARLVHCESEGWSVSYKGYDSKNHNRVFGSVSLKGE